MAEKKQTAELEEKKQTTKKQGESAGETTREELASPGWKIREELRERGMLQKEFAMRMGLTEKHVSKLINGEVLLTADVAVRLETVLGIPTAEWYALEAKYRESLIRAEAEADVESEIELAQCFPYAEMARLGWVPETRQIREKIRHLKAFFEVVDLNLLEKWSVSGMAWRELSIYSKEDLTVMAWTQAARRKARERQAGPLNVKGLEALIPDLREWTNERMTAFLPKLEEALAQQGILLVFLPRLRGLSIQTATVMAGNKAVIAMTAKKMDDNEFWTRLLHELGHIWLGHVWLESGTVEQDERDANLWARNALITRSEFDAFKDAGSFVEKSICEFALLQGIAPGIVLGRMQYEGLIGGGTLNRLKREYRFDNVR